MLAELICNAFDMPEAFVPWIAALSGRARWRAFAALEATTIVGAGYLYLDGAGAWLGLGSVRPEHRRRGVQRALMALRIREAIAAGCTQITTETGEPVADEPNPSLINMRHCGFRQVCSRLNYAGQH
jgi:GNAT superfamily N-acetyltransferase